MWRILTQAVLLAAQLDPSLTPHKAPKPALPKVDQNSCPFEGCQFGTWTVTQPARIYSTWEPQRKLLRTLPAGEKVSALTGVYITIEPSQVRVTAPMPEYNLKPGDTVFLYMSIGEGFYSAWFNGYWVDEFDGSSIRGLGCNRGCTAELLKPGRTEWWVRIKAADGTIGWTRDSDHFDGKDALARLRRHSSIVSTAKSA